MKHTGIKILSLLLLITVMSISLISCFEDPKSAYDIAVENGYVGTEEQWLASLKGQDLDIMDIYAAAVADGNYTGDGDFLTFLTDYLHLDSEAVAEAILAHQAKDTAYITALPLLSSVSVECSSSALGGSNSAVGSGVILSVEKNSGDAYILTNYHVVMQSNAPDATVHNSIQVFLYGDTRSAENVISAKCIGGSYTYDLAVLRVKGSDRIKSSSVVPVIPADSETVVAGTDAIAIGNGAGLGISVTRGIVSIESKNVRIHSDSAATQRLIQIDTPVNEGNSGGGLFNAEGKLIGIVSAKVEEVGVENIGYAIPSNIALRAANRIITDFEAGGGADSTLINPVDLRYLHLGIEIYTEDTHAVYDMERGVTYIAETVKVNSVTLNTPAKAMGLTAGDIITTVQVDDRVIPVIRDYSLRDALMLCNIGSVISITVQRGGAEHTLTLTVTASHLKTVD